MKLLRSLLVALAAFVTAVSPALAEDFLPGVKRVLFLGDSITYSGQYTELFDAFLFTQFPGRQIEVIDCGLPSETCSGLSEAGHAGGKFPRPDVHERLDRVLALVKPDLVFACYGMNCGIYLPLDDKRFAAYQAGRRKLQEKVEKAGAKLIHLTPPVFDAMPIAKRTKPADVVKDGEFFEGYDAVLGRYSEWLVEQGKVQRWRVIDTHTPMAAALAEKRKTAPSFSYARDGVHANNDGHRVIAEAILAALAPEKAAAFWKLLDGDWAKSAEGREFLSDIHKRNRLLCDSYLTTAGHLRPGMAKGLPVAEAEEKAAALEVKIREALWKKIQTGPFSFSAPASFKKVEVRGIDSFVGEFVDEGIRLSFDYGQYSYDFADWPEEKRLESLTVNGSRARIGTKENKPGSNFRFHTHITIYVTENVGMRGVKLGMSADCKTEKELATARKIFESIKFDLK